MTYSKIIPIEFNHCDPAGIVFYPRYFEMINSVVENFFADVVGRSFAQMHAGGKHNGVPTVRIEANFAAPSRLGEKVDFALNVGRVGSSSLALTIAANHQGEHRLRVDLTVVWINGGRAAPWPADMRANLLVFQETKA